MTINIKKVTTRKEMSQFHRLPWKIYKDDKNWVPSLRIDEREKTNKEKFPFFEHSEADFFLALKDGSVTGRIAAIKNNNHLMTYQDDVGFFGFFECINDQEVANALFFAAEKWLAERGLKKIRGPENYSQNETAGLLIDAFDIPPVIELTYNPEYYKKLIENYRFEKIKDLYAYALYNVSEIPERIVRTVGIAEKRYNVIVRPIEIKKLDEEARKIVEIYNQAWSENWGAVKLTEREMEHIKEQLKMILIPGMALIAEIDGKPVGTSLTVPDINRLLIKMNGRLFPFNIFRLLFYKFRNWKNIGFVRVYIMGVLEEHRKKGIDLAFYYYTFKHALERGIHAGEMSWILEDNFPMINAIQRIPGAHQYKTYRLYQKDIQEP
ncbi:MAG: N-acetyltransferase [Candidatus Marinimicrobia bacterium]|nr:N-acetyltransferase [Candidatus Neomarinimicrobiota bacterium]